MSAHAWLCSCLFLHARECVYVSEYVRVRFACVRVCAYGSMMSTAQYELGNTPGP